MLNPVKVLAKASIPLVSLSTSPVLRPKNTSSLALLMVRPNCSGAEPACFAKFSFSSSLIASSLTLFWAEIKAFSLSLSLLV